MVCPACRAEVRSRPLERHGEYALYLCPACDLQFCKPMRGAGRAFYEQHDFYRFNLRVTSERLLNWQHVRFLRDGPCPGGTLLDVGCGTGYFLAAGQRAGYRVAGIDLSRDAIAVGRRRFGLEDLHDGMLAEFIERHPARTFDVVTFFDLLEHLDDPRGFLEQVKRVVKPRGYVALSVPNWRVWAAFRDPLDRPPNHLTRWSVASLGRFLAAQGLQPVTVAQERSAFSLLNRRVGFGIVRRLVRSAPATGHAPAGLDGVHRTATQLAVAKASLLRMVDLPIAALLHVMRAPGLTLYCLARVGGEPRTGWS